jgi:hypothetical protein
MSTPRLELHKLSSSSYSTASLLSAGESHIIQSSISAVVLTQSFKARNDLAVPGGDRASQDSGAD